MLKSSRVLAVVALALAPLLSLPLQADDGSSARTIDPSYQHETSEYKDVFRTIRLLGNKCNPAQVVVAFDLDNTLLANDEPLGSEQWFDWQYDLLQNKTDPSSKTQLVARDFKGLLKVEDFVSRTMTMHPTEKELPAELNEIENAGYKVLVLTSRGPEQLKGTLNELHRNGFHFEKSTLKAMSHLKPKSRPTLFQDGVFLTSGLDKGMMLRSILSETHTKACGVVFVDNKELYSQQMREAFRDVPVTLVTFRYSREDDAMERFAKGNKGSVIRAWKELARRRHFR